MRDQEAQESARNADDGLSESHTARTRSAAARTAATCHYLTSRQSALVAKREAGEPLQGPVLKTEHAVRTATEALTALSASASDPAAASRCARNAAAAAALAAQTAQAHDQAHDQVHAQGRADGHAAKNAVAASRAALQASLAAGAAAAGGNPGRDQALNEKADAAEKAAVDAAEKAGWMQPGREYLSQSESGGEFTISLADVMHLEH
ncbi:hypothetical protein [Streptomyces sp. Da 82-17]|uniref:hypothetical protein n=1 Tax=Streptomyces sp. Da 82-17 TaxID=3377116 RepID=UPI0038D36418